MSEPKLYRILQVTFIIVAAACLVTSVVVFADGTNLLKTYFRAWDHLHGHEYALAAEGFEECVARRPQAKHFWVELGIARYHVGDYKGANQALRTGWCVTVGDPFFESYSPLAHLRALKNGEQPVGMLPRLFQLDVPEEPPEQYLDAQSDLCHGRYGEAAGGFEACLGRMPDTPGETDALWGLAIARFHAGDHDGALEALEAIRAAWGKEPSEAFETIVGYVRTVAAGGETVEELPPVLARYAPRTKE